MNLREARVRFSYLFAEKLLPKVTELGLQYAFDEITNHQNQGHVGGSLHYFGCAGDLILYDMEGKYITDTETYQPLGEFWESLDENCRWGGRFRDGNHFSYSPKELFGNKA